MNNKEAFEDWNYQQTKYEAIIAEKDKEIERLSNAISDYCDWVKPKQVSEIEKGGK